MWISVRVPVRNRTNSATTTTPSKLGRPANHSRSLVSYMRFLLASTGIHPDANDHDQEQSDESDGHAQHGSGRGISRPVVGCRDRSSWRVFSGDGQLRERGNRFDTVAFAFAAVPHGERNVGRLVGVERRLQVARWRKGT